MITHMILSGCDSGCVYYCSTVLWVEIYCAQIVLACF